MRGCLRWLTVAATVAPLVLFTSLNSVAQDRTWNVNGAGSYNTNGNWSPGDVPDTAGENAIVTSPDGTTAVVVTTDAGSLIDVNNLTVASNAPNPAHELVISNDTFFDVHGDISNDGVIEINGVDRNTDLRLETSDLAITGTGTLRLTQDDFSRVLSLGDFLLTNGAGHTIEGNGRLGGNTARIFNLGTIDANVNGGTLTVDPRSGGAGAVTFNNGGVVRASNGGTLLLLGANGGEFGGAGSYQALAGSEVVMSFNAIFRGTSFSTTGDGVVRALAGNNLEWHDVINSGLVVVDANTDLRVHGTIANVGTITLPTVGSAADIELGGNVLLTGGGIVNMTGLASRINAIGDFTLTNVSNTIQGSGNIGGNQARFVNLALIDANDVSEPLVIDPRSGGVGVVTFDNQNIAQATAGATLRLSGNAGGEFGGTGTYQALAGSAVELIAGAVARDTTFDTEGDGLVRTGSSDNIEFHDVTNNGNLQISNNSDLRMHGTITNSGHIAVASTASAADFELGGDVTLNGGGTVTFSGPIATVNAIGDFTLTNLDNTLHGTGNIGANLARIANQGHVEARTGELLRIDPRSGGAGIATFDNQNVVQALGGGTIELSGNAGGEFGGSGTYIAQDGSEVVLITNAIARNTTFDSAGTGLVRTGTSQNIEFHDVTNQGTLQISNNSDLRMHGTITNAGTIAVASTGNNARFELGSSILLTGGGTVDLSGPAASVTAIGDFALINSTNTLQGEGTIGGNTARVVNQATIDANVDGATLRLDPRTGGAGVVTFDNEAIAQASGGGTLELSGNAGGEFGGSGIYRAMAGSQVALANGAIARNTTFDTVGDGLVRIPDNQNIEFHDVINAGALEVGNNTDLRVHGSLTNNGTITLASTGGNSDFELGADVTLAGIGALNFSGPAARIDTISPAFTLTNDDGHAITGAGQINANIINFGTITGTSATEFFEINNTLSGSGDIANVRIDGRHEPGTSVAAIDAAGLYQLSSTAVLEIEIGGTTPSIEHDQIVATGDVMLDGTLALKSFDVFQPATTDTFTVLTSVNALSGSFDNATATMQAPNFTIAYDVIHATNTVTLEEASRSVFAGDYNGNGVVDAGDYTVWRDRQGTSGLALFAPGDGDGDGDIDQADYDVWRTNFGLVAPAAGSTTAIPEPAAALLLVVAVIIGPGQRRG